MPKFVQYHGVEIVRAVRRQALSGFESSITITEFVLTQSLVYEPSNTRSVNIQRYCSCSRESLVIYSRHVRVAKLIAWKIECCNNNLAQRSDSGPSPRRECMLNYLR